MRTKVAIIGGGLAGLSAGCYAAMNGFEAHIFEHHTVPGGVAAAWKREITLSMVVSTLSWVISLVRECSNC